MIRRFGKEDEGALWAVYMADGLVLGSWAKLAFLC